MTDTMNDILAIIEQRPSSHASDKIIETLLARDSLLRQACEDLRDALKYANAGMLSESAAHFELYLEKIKKLDDLPLRGRGATITKSD